MKEWSRKQKITLGAVFAVVLIVAAVAAGMLNRRDTMEGIKTFAVQVTSERDDYSKTEECRSEEEYLGGFLRTYKDCEWVESDYGIYITGFSGMEEDMENQYWWCVMVNGESATTGADQIPLKDGDTYEFVLTKGW